MRLKNRTLSGAVNGQWLQPGDVFEADEENGARYVALGYATKIESKEERAVPPTDKVETATPPKRTAGRSK